MAWKCSLELTHVYNIYCGNTPPRAPQLRRSIKSHNPLWVCKTHPEGRGSIWVDLLSRRNSVIRSTLYIYDARYRHITPPTDPARRNIGSPVISRISIRLSASVFSFHISARVPACVHGDVRRRHVDFYLRLPLSRCAEILSWITINLSQ